MKTLIIIRHAKAESVFSLNDFERPLNERGKNDVPVMAKRLLDRKLKVGAFVSSPAKRARKTAGLFADAMGYNENDIVLVSALYQAPPAVFYEVVESLGEHFNTVALFAHNPGITEFVNDLSTVVQIDNMPTCGIYAVEANCKHWADFSKAKKEFLFFDYPKNI